MADGSTASGLTSQSWVQTPSKKKTPRPLSSLPDVAPSPPVEEVEELQVASKSPKLDRLEVCFYEQIQALCSKEEITPTTLMEGVLTVLEGHPEVKAAVILVAKERRRIRVDLWRKRKLETEMRKLKEGF